MIDNYPPPLFDDLGAPVPLAGPVRRVVSLVPSLTEAIATSRPEILVAATDWCTHLAGLELPRVRGTKNPDLKQILALAPDLVVGNQEENRELDVQRLRAAGVPVWVTRIETLAQAFDSLSRLFTTALADPGAGSSEEPDWLVEARTVWAHDSEPGRLSAAVPIWRDPWMVVGSSTFTGDLLARLGVRNCFGDRPERYPSLSVAEIAAAAPDLVLLPDEPYPFSAADGPEALPGLATALVSGRSLTWYGPSLVAARAELAAVLASH